MYRLTHKSRYATGLFLLPVSLAADQLRFDTVQGWQQWKLPLGAVELTQEGHIQPVPVRKNIDAVLDAWRFGGGIRGAGSNPQDAALVMDGDPATGWSPDPDDSPEDWWVEIDLGRVVSAQQIRLAFAADSPPFELFDLLLSNGEQARNNIGSPIPGTLIYQVRERFRENGDHDLSFVPEQPEHTLVQVLRLKVLKAAPGAHLVGVEVEAFGDNLALGLLNRGGKVDIVVEEKGGESGAVPLGNSLYLADGSLNTAWRYGRASRGEADIEARITLDLGATYWVDLVRLVSARWLDFNFYEILTSDGSLAPNGTLIWHQNFSGWPSAAERWNRMTDHPFALLPARYIRIAWKYWDAHCSDESGSGGEREGCSAGGSTAELQVYGEGYPREVQLRSPRLDLGRDQSINTLCWQARTPPGTRVEVRSRTGNELIPRVAYHDKNGKEVTQKKWEKLLPYFRGPIDTTFTGGPDWSPWSRPYLLSGEAFQSPSPRRYLELEVCLVSERPDTAASLDWLSVEFSTPLAQEVVGELYPVEAAPGVERAFSYFLRAPVTAAGFDRLAVEASTPLRFAGTFLNDERTAAEVQSNGKGFEVRFPRSVHQGELVELRFAAAIFLDATRFEVFLEDSRQGMRQQVEPGDATERVASSTDVVRLPTSSGLFANLAITPTVLTPNGDGINDELLLSFALVNVLESRPLCLCIFNLAGRLVWEVEKEGIAGAQSFIWDGREDGGKLVPPGIYLLRLVIEGDARSEALSRLVQVVY